MAASKRRKQIKQHFDPEDKKVGQRENPEKYYNMNPAWNFSTCDNEKWSLFSEESQIVFWDEIMPHLQSWEQQTWSDILVRSKKQNHSIAPDSLNKLAIERMERLYIEGESIISLRLTSTHRIYGYIHDNIFCMLWVDLDHGDNDGCVCRSRQKHT